MQLEQAKAEFTALVAKISPLNFSKTKSRLKHTAKVLNLACVNAETDQLSCSFCGSNITVCDAHPVLRDGSPVAICEDCFCKTGMQEI